MGRESERRRVLVVDDNQDIRKAVSSIVAYMGFEVAEACNGAEALALFSQRRFDLILTDLQMPKMDGLNLAERIKRESPKTPIVLITGSIREWVEKRIGEKPIDRVVYKPFRMEEILNTVKSFFGTDVAFLKAGL